VESSEAWNLKSEIQRSVESSEAWNQAQRGIKRSVESQISNLKSEIQRSVGPFSGQRGSRSFIHVAAAVRRQKS